MTSDAGVAYEADDRCSLLLTLGMGAQFALILIAPTAITISLLADGAGLGPQQSAWMMFAAVVLSGVGTAMQSLRWGYLGGAHIQLMPVLPSILAAALLAMEAASAATLASLIVVSSLVPLIMAAWLPRLRSVITPMVSGAVLMLLAVSVLLAMVARLGRDAETAGTEITVAVVTLGVAAVLGLRARGPVRLFSPLITILTGCVVAVSLGLYDTSTVSSAAWFGVPSPHMPGLDVTPGADFWSLLPMFLIISVATSINALSGNVLIQRVSRNEQRATDFRLVQGSLNSMAAANMLGGLSGTLPLAGAGALSVAVIKSTGVAARRTGYGAGAVIVAVALVPKAMALLLSVPNAVAAAFVIFVMGTLFVEGMRTAVPDIGQPHTATVLSVSLGLGVALAGTDRVAETVGGALGTMLNDGVTIGTLTAIALTTLLGASLRRRPRLEVAFGMESLGKIHAFLDEVATANGWDEAARLRLRLVGEEVLTSLSESRSDARKLALSARSSAAGIELEFMASSASDNLEDRLSDLSSDLGSSVDGSVSLHLLRHFATSVRHRKYRTTDVVNVEVERPR